MPTNTTGPIKDVSKEVKYLNKDFEGFRNDLIEYAKTYFPTTYTDFNESSPGMMFIEMAAYIGDVLSYYVDSQFKESILAYAEEKRTIYNIAQSLGYKPIDFKKAPEGSIMIIPTNNTNLKQPNMRTFMQIDKVQKQTLSLLSLSGWYSSLRGPLPFALGMISFA